MPIEGNHKGSYLTFRSKNGLVFAIDLLVAGFSTVWLDQAYWQRAIASRPETSVKAYIFGGMAWYGIPFGFATAMGLGCAALTSSPSFPTYPNPLSATQNGSGLSSPAAAIALYGKGGAGLMLLLLFMAVTSSTSAELIAVSSLLTFDVYKTYLKPHATSAQLVRVSHLGIILYACLLAVFCCILNAVSVNLTWLLTVLGIIVGGASVPVGLVLLWPRRMSTVAAIGAPWIGLALGLVAWFVTTKARSGTISVLTTGDATNAVAGNITSWAGGALVCVVLSLVFPNKNMDIVDSERTNKIMGIAVLEKRSNSATPPAEPQQTDEDAKTPSSTDEKVSEKGSSAQPETIAPTSNPIVDFLEASHIVPMDPAEVKRSTRLAVGFNLLFLVIAILVVPFSFFGDGFIFGRKAFTGWVVVSFMWVWSSMVICVLWPLWESRKALGGIVRGVWADIGGARQRGEGVGDSSVESRDTRDAKEV